MPRLPSLACLALFALAGCGGPGPGDAPLVERIEGREARQIALLTSDPYDFVAARAGAPRETRITGRLRFPAEGMPIRGAAILSHGSGGPGGRQERMADWLAERGVASLLLDHFGARGIGSTVEDQLRVTEQTMLADIAQARALLATHPEISAGRIGMIGWSKGALGVTLGAVDRLAGFVDLDAPAPAFAVAFYPFCGFDLDGERLATPLLLLLGAADDWTPPGPCLRQAEAWAAAGQPVEAEIYEDAPHGFDSRLWFDLTVDRAITVRRTDPACTLTVDADGASVVVEGEGDVSSLESRRDFLARCGERGVTFGSDGAARRAAYGRIDAFLDRVLGPGG